MGRYDGPNPIRKYVQIAKIILKNVKHDKNKKRAFGPPVHVIVQTWLELMQFQQYEGFNICRVWIENTYSRLRVCSLFIFNFRFFFR